MRSSNTLGNVGSLLQDVVDTTEDLALSTDVGTSSEFSELSPKMRMAIMKNRIMKSAMEISDSLEEKKEDEDYSASIDSGLVTTETSRGTQQVQ